MLTAERLSQVQLGSLEWMWQPYLARGKLALLDGDPGVGKSLVTLDLAARLSRGFPMPGCTGPSEPAAVLLLNAEDAAEDTVRPRAEAAGADLDRLVRIRDALGRTPRLPDDLPTLEQLIGDYRAALVVIDPIMAFLPPKVAANADQCVRQALTPLTAIAERTGAVVVANRHLNKREGTKALYRGSGSVGILGAARAGLLITRFPTDPDLRVLSVTKSNLTETPPSFGFRIGSDVLGRSRIEWTGPVDQDADELSRAVRAVRPRDRAMNWLEAELAAGPRRAADLLTAAFAVGIPERTLHRAKKDLHVESHQVRSGPSREWYWYNPEAPWPENAPFKKPRPLLDPLPPLEPLERWR